VVDTPILIEALTVGFPNAPLFVVIKIIPLDALAPKIADEDASLIISMVSISAGFISLIEPLNITPSNTISGVVDADNDEGPLISNEPPPEALAP
jgi:hypothetical protein